MPRPVVAETAEELDRWLGAAPSASPDGMIGQPMTDVESERMLNDLVRWANGALANKVDEVLARWKALVAQDATNGIHRWVLVASEHPDSNPVYDRIKVLDPEFARTHLAVIHATDGKIAKTVDGLDLRVDEGDDRRGSGDAPISVTLAAFQPDWPSLAVMLGGHVVMNHPDHIRDIDQDRILDPAAEESTVLSMLWGLGMLPGEGLDMLPKLADMDYLTRLRFFELLPEIRHLAKLTRVKIRDVPKELLPDRVTVPGRARLLLRIRYLLRNPNDRPPARP